MADDPKYFTWYELMTTDVAGAAAFYRDVVGWGTKADATARLPYTFFTVGEVPAAGLIELPEEGRKMGAVPRWAGYVGVADVHATVDRIKRLGGAVYVPPTETNIGRLSVVADPDAASFAIVDRLRTTPQQPADSGKPGRIGWHELFAADPGRDFAFYAELFGWQKLEYELNPEKSSFGISVGGHVIGGAFNKHSDDRVPFWLLYFNVDDLDAAVERVRAGGGKAYGNKEELPGRLSAAHCLDPQGAVFALRGKQSHARTVGWSAEWQGFSSRGQMLTPKPRPESGSDS